MITTEIVPIPVGGFLERSIIHKQLGDSFGGMAIPQLWTPARLVFSVKYIV
jgi:hypothetical protein